MISRKMLTVCSRTLINNYVLLESRKNITEINKKCLTYVLIDYFKSNSRTFSTLNENHTSFYQDKDVTAPDSEEYKNKFIAQKLQKLFDIPIVQAKDVIKKYPKLRTVIPDSINDNYKTLRDASVDNEILLQYPTLLILHDLKWRLKIMQDIPVDINLIAPLLSVSSTIIQRIAEQLRIEANFIPEGNRIMYMSNLLNVPSTVICEKILQHIFILRMPFERLENILNVLLKYGVESKSIINDFWALRYSPAIAEQRLQQAIESNVVKVKSWMIRCPDKVLERCINRQIENRKILGTNSSVEEYLSKRLECSLANAKYLTEKYPALMKMNIPKMKEMIDYLYEQNYKPAHICRVPRILIHSLETTKIRTQQLKDLGYTPPSLAILCKSKKDFDKTFKKYLKRVKGDIQEDTKTNKKS